MRNSRELPAPAFVRASDPLPAFGSVPFVTAVSVARAHRVSSGHSFYMRRGKRALDLAVSAVLLTAALPLFPLIALALRLEGKGPVLDRSLRQGETGPFAFYKFRSLAPGAREVPGRAFAQPGGPLFASVEDARVTRVGRFLRRTSLDELPQLVNVLRGDMSLVGPRPPHAEDVHRYEPWQLARLEVKPGITCLWQVSGRSALSFDEWMRLDLQYIRHRSLGLDLKILLRTVPAVLSREGAY
jgi:lipopolysaccharide/colanic/teichoic acid biosynthesis glycosyltransferase